MVLGDFWKSLMVARQLELRDGHIEEFGVRMAFLPTFTLNRLMEQLYEELGDHAFDILFDLGKAHGKHIVREVGGRNSISKKRFFNEMLESGNALGLGKIEAEQLSPNQGKFVIRITDSPFAEGLCDSETFEDYDQPVDMFTRGIAHGITEEMFDSEVVSKETHCEFLGDPYCRFVFKTKE